jgi:hypothetical protein
MVEDHQIIPILLLEDLLPVARVDRLHLEVADHLQVLLLEGRVENSKVQTVKGRDLMIPAFSIFINFAKPPTVLGNIF